MAIRSASYTAETCLRHATCAGVIHRLTSSKSRLSSRSDLLKVHLEAYCEVLQLVGIYDCFAFMTVNDMCALKGREGN